ncbi:MAG TPA: ferritin family protein [Deltaproteobacteria bacterium]|jgi:rubrerythrin|nr:ferritin family protein [Deltaproteobacteria bacterium]HQJ07594.1 ferritin family protein [Deltaproteobacteria bacterium]
MDQSERINALELALNNEKNEREFYLEHAGRTKNPLGRVMFQQIADDELEHYTRLKELHEKWEKAEKWPESVPLAVKQTDIGSTTKSMLKKLDVKEESDADYLKAVEIAVEFEARGMNLYTTLKDEVSDPREKAFFALLAGIEREHYLSLRDVEEFLKDPEGWLRRTERHTLDGA